MKKNVIFGFLLTCSLVLNLAVLGVWVTHAISHPFTIKNKSPIFQTTSKSFTLQQSLQLNSCQWNSIKPLIDTYQVSAQEICHKVMGAREALINEIEKPQPDTVILKQLRNKILDGQQTMQDLSIHQILLEKEMLSADQCNRFFSMIRSNMGCDGKPGMMGLGTTMSRCNSKDSSPCLMTK
jgi:hypothetical protein